MKIRKVLRVFVSVEDDEIPSVVKAFLAFFFLLCSYFICLPIRDEAALSLGTELLPSLFLVSLFATLLAAPLSSTLLSREDISKGQALTLLYRFFSFSLILFFALYLFIPPPPSSAPHMPLTRSHSLRNGNSSLSERRQLLSASVAFSFTENYERGRLGERKREKNEGRAIISELTQRRNHLSPSLASQRGFSLFLSRLREKFTMWERARKKGGEEAGDKERAREEALEYEKIGVQKIDVDGGKDSFSFSPPAPPSPFGLPSSSSSLLFFLSRSGLFVWIALLNLFTLSAMWARMADLMSHESSKRLFGFIASGATLGQLIGSLLASLLTPLLGNALLLLASLCLEFASQCALCMEREGGEIETKRRGSEMEGEEKRLLPSTTFPISSSSSSPSLPPPSPPFSPPFPQSEPYFGRERRTERGDSIPESVQKLGMEERGREREKLAVTFESLVGEALSGEGRNAFGDAGKRKSKGGARERGGEEGERGREVEIGMRREGGGVQEGDEGGRKGTKREISLRLFHSSKRTFSLLPSELIESIRMICRSPYLLHICLFLLLTASISSFFYFEKACVVALAVNSPEERRILIARINGLCAFFTLFFQLTLSSRVIAFLGVTFALCSSPFVSLLGLSAIALSPTPLVLAVVEASRKVINYSLTRPGRETLFTVISKDEKYKAKIAIDTLVQRIGDACAASVFQFLSSGLSLGTQGVALFALPVCAAWLIIGFHLGRRRKQMAHLLFD